MTPNLIKALLPALLMICLVRPGIAQDGTLVFTPSQDDLSKQKSMLDAITRQHEKNIASLSGSNKKYIAEIYTERYDLIKKKFEEKEIISSPVIEGYLNSLVNNITENNPTLRSLSPRIVFSKTWWPNAYSMGEGTIIFNIGLFNRLQNESQAIFVICHELAHLYLDHGNKGIHNYVNTLYSKEFQEKLKEIKKSDYEKNKQLNDLAKGITFKSRRHSRGFEHQADSMAVEFMKNTGYDLRESLSCLALLDSVDNDKYDLDLQLAKQFNFPTYAFKKRWIEKEKTLIVEQTETVQEKKDQDSLKTHPDCKTRVKTLAPLVERYAKPGGKKFIQGEEQFKTFKQQFDYEILNYCFSSGRISRCLFYSLQMLQQFPSNAYLITITGKCLNELYSNQKKHELNKIVDLPGPDHDERYNQLLLMIQNLRLPEISSLSYHFLKEREAQMSSYSEFKSVFETSKQNLQ